MKLFFEFKLQAYKKFFGDFFKQGTFYALMRENYLYLQNPFMYTLSNKYTANGWFTVYCGPNLATSDYHLFRSMQKALTLENRKTMNSHGDQSMAIKFKKIQFKIRNLPILMQWNFNCNTALFIYCLILFFYALFSFFLHTTPSYFD